MLKEHRVAPPEQSPPLMRGPSGEPGLGSTSRPTIGVSISTPAVRRIRRCHQRRTLTGDSYEKARCF
jgi:hypothetical protein